MNIIKFNNWGKSCFTGEIKLLIKYIKNLLQSWFNFPNNKVYCQISTIASENPHIRTMGLYDITKDGHLIFFTETNTRKWEDLQKISNIAACILHADYGQIIIEGSAILKTCINDNDFANFYWHNFLDQYWRDFYLSHSSDQNSLSEEAPRSFGIIMIIPKTLEILEINKEDYLKSSRKQFQLIDGTWKIFDLPAL